MNIGNRISQLRKSLNLTQAQLANAIGVSIPAVSKWETGTTLPDITLLAPLARKLETDVNDLISYQESLLNWEVDIMNRDMIEVFKTEGYKVGVEKSLLSLNQYPNNNYLKLNVANRIILYRSMGDNDCTDEELKRIYEKSEEILYEVYMQPHPDDHPIINAAAISTLIARYIDNNKLSEAEELLVKLPKETSSGRELLKNIYFMQGKLDETLTITQEELLVDSIRIITDIHVLFNVALKQENYDKAIGFAKDYYVISQTINYQSILPSQLLVEVYITMKDYKNAYNQFETYIEEILNTETAFNNSKYFDVIEDTIQTWNQNVLGDYKTSMYKAITSNKLFEEFLEADDVMLLLNKLSCE